MAYQMVFIVGVYPEVLFHQQEIMIPKKKKPNKEFLRIIFLISGNGYAKLLKLFSLVVKV